MEKEKEKFISTIEFLRGFAMLSICYTHYKIHFIVNDFWFYSMIYADFGVSLFFVISGFVIPLSLFEKKYSISDYPKFIAKRLLRVYPPFIAGLLLTIILTYIANFSPFHHGVNNSISLKYIITNLFLIPQFLNQPWYSPVLWTLAIEMQFYLLIGLIAPFLFSDKKWIQYLTIFLFGGIQFITKDERFLSFHSMVFLIGIIGFLKYKEKINAWEWFIITTLILAGIAFKMELTTTKFIALPITICLILFVPLKNKFFEFCGKISYSYYILHIIIGGSLIIDFGKNFIHSVIGINLLTFSTILILIPISWIFHSLFEVPFQKLGKKINAA
jgi:peptidoglycan/LPS O-acetylase OafA/YrhL